MNLFQQTLLPWRPLLAACGFCVALGGAGCSDGDGTEPVNEPKGLWRSCKAHEDCESKICVDGYCSKKCSALEDCPIVEKKEFFCGEALPDDKPGEAYCYPKQHDDREHATGYDCSADVCAVGWKCFGQVGSADRYCSPKCKNDKQCPPKYRCASIKKGAGKPEKRCVRRQFGHPCLIDDQCGGPKDSCIKDKNGNRYCSKQCSKGGDNCPDIARCEDAGNNNLQCRHKAGYAYTDQPKNCDPCVLHFQVRDGRYNKFFTDADTCGKGFCYNFSAYTRDNFCMMPCDSAGKCSGDFACVDFKSLGKKVCIPVKPGTTDRLRGCHAPLNIDQSNN